MKKLNKLTKVILIFGVIFSFGMFLLIRQDKIQLKKFKKLSESYLQAPSNITKIDSLNILAKKFKLTETIKKQDTEVNILIAGSLIIVAIAIATDIYFRNK